MNYKDGRTLKKHYCIEVDCNNEISYSSWKNGSGRCKSCAMTKTAKKEILKVEIILILVNIQNFPKYGE